MPSHATAVAINAPPAVPRQELSSLGRVNVICGRNSSGKSTLFRALCPNPNETTRVFGARVDDPDADPEFWERLAALHKVTASNFGQSDLGRIIRGIGPVPIYEDQLETIAKRINDSCSQLHQHFQHPDGAMRVAKQLKAAIPPSKTRWMVIPPKRRIEPTCPLNPTPLVEPHGAGLIAELFLLNAQSEDSPFRAWLHRFSSAFTEVSEGYRYQITLGRESHRAGQLHLTLSRGNNWLPVDQFGLGLQDLLVLTYWALHESNDAICIEEPESHLHPDLQRRLLRFLRETGKQVFLSTHSNVIVASPLVDRVFSTSWNGTISIRDESSRAEALAGLGYSVLENLVADVIVLVEGPSDVPVLENLLTKRPDMNGKIARFWPLGGDIMGQVDLSVFSERSRVLAMIDRDPGSSKVRERFNAKCAESGIHVHQLKRRAIENYFPIEAFRTVFKGQVPPELTKIDPHRRVEEQMRFAVKRRNKDLASATQLDDIAGTDLEEFLNLVSKEAARTQ